MAGGGIVYVMIYLLALSGLSGTVNLVADGLFLGCTLVSLWQVGVRTRRHAADRRHRDGSQSQAMVRTSSGS